MPIASRCQFGDCFEPIPPHYFLCTLHYVEYETGAIDQCPACGKYKQVTSGVCRTCYRKPPDARAHAPPRVTPGPGPPPPDPILLAALRALRRHIAREHQIPEYQVFSNDTLAKMAAARPTTPAQLLAISGVGNAKLQRYGKSFRDLIKRHSGTDHSTNRPASVPPTTIRRDDHRHSGIDRPANRPASEPPTTLKRDDREFPPDRKADRFFVYILLLNDQGTGQYYVGQTRELHERLHEHRNNMSQSTRGRGPKLQWFTTVPTRREAADLEAELQDLNSNAIGRRAINRLIVDFQRLTAELDYTRHDATAENNRPEPALPHGGVKPKLSRRAPSPRG